jgi:glyoxylase I family protein
VAEPQVPHWSHVGLNCRDINITEQFYRTWFGFHRARLVDLGDDQIVFLRNGDAYLELFRSTAPEADRATGDGPAAPGIARHIAFQIDDVDSFVGRLDGTVEVTLGPLSFDDFIPGWKTAWLKDPDGVVVEISQGYRDQEPAVG